MALAQVTGMVPVMRGSMRLPKTARRGCGPLADDLLAELRRLDEGVARACGVVAQALVGEEEEEFVSDDWPAEASAELPELLLDALARLGRAVVLVEGVEARLVVLEEEAAVKLVRAVLRDDLDLRARVAPVLGRVRA